MIGQVQSLKIYLASAPVDMRKSFDSLAAVARDFLRLDPLSGNLFVFFNKKRDKVKVLYWGRTGYCLFYKRMERGRFKIKNLGKPAWAHPVVAGGRLYIRNRRTLTAYGVR